eukprot:COSAG01_NODE_15735_length_1305_cov_1.287728_1_plen_42_part_10
MGATSTSPRKYWPAVLLWEVVVLRGEEVVVAVEASSLDAAAR